MPTLETLVAAARKRDELEAQVIETKALRRSNVVKTAVLRSVSHDLRSPLTAITAAAAGLAFETLSPAAREELTSVIAVESARLSRLVDNLLDLSKLQAGAVEPHADWYSVEELVRAAIDSVPQPPGGFDIQIDAGVTAVAHRRRPARASARERPRQRQPLLGRRAGQRARAAPPPSRLLLRVIDHGPGVAAGGPRAHLRALSSLGDGSGTGLGLAIARGFVEANGGRIRAESLPGQGTTFVLACPCRSSSRRRRLSGGRMSGGSACWSATTRRRSCALCA